MERKLRSIRGGRKPGPKPKAPKLKPVARKASGKAQCPAYLTAEARKEWKRLAPKLEELGLLTSADQSTFAILCTWYAKVVDATNKLKRVKLANKHDQITPYYTALTKASDNYLKYADRFGLSPTARQTIHELTNGGVGNGEEDTGEARVTDRNGKPI